ncbi:MAG: dockerin type I domain-containing protein, partial [Aureliella sp.]
ATTGSKVFRPYSVSQVGYANGWSQRRQLKIEFALPTSFVSADILGTGISYGRLELYSADGTLLDRATTAQLSAGQSQKLELGRPTPDIAYAIIRGHMGTEIGIDNIAYGPKTQTTTDASGRYAFTNLPAGNYRVQVALSGVVSRVTSPSGAQQDVTWQSQQASQGQSIQHVDFGINSQSTAWHNVQLAADVNGDGHVTAIDALLVINLINQGVESALTGSSIPFTPYIDVSNDAFVTALDALMVINAINAGSGSGEGDAPQAGAAITAAPVAAEGELAIAPVIDDYRQEIQPDAHFEAAAARPTMEEGRPSATDCLFSQ